MNPFSNKVTFQATYQVKELWYQNSDGFESSSSLRNRCDTSDDAELELDPLLYSAQGHISPPIMTAGWLLQGVVYVRKLLQRLTEPCIWYLSSICWSLDISNGLVRYELLTCTLLRVTGPSHYSNEVGPTASYYTAENNACIVHGSKNIWVSRWNCSIANQIMVFFTWKIYMGKVAQLGLKYIGYIYVHEIKDM